MFFVLGSGDTPEIKSGGAIVFGVENHLDEQDGASGEFAFLVAGGGMSVETSLVVIVDQGSGENLVLIFGVIESGEARFELVLEMRFVLGSKMVLVGDATQEGGKNGDVLGILGSVDGEAFFGATLPILNIGLAHGLENGLLRLIEVDNPSMGGQHSVMSQYPNISLKFRFS